MAYGTEKHDDYFVEMADRAKEGKLLADEIAHLRDELDTMASQGQPAPGVAAAAGGTRCRAHAREGCSEFAAGPGEKA
jgi:hypothetical protein